LDCADAFTSGVHPRVVGQHAQVVPGEREAHGARAEVAAGVALRDAQVTLSSRKRRKLASSMYPEYTPQRPRRSARTFSNSEADGSTAPRQRANWQRKSSDELYCLYPPR
jgi:hypothetical protein